MFEEYKQKLDEKIDEKVDESTQKITEKVNEHIDTVGETIMNKLQDILMFFMHVILDILVILALGYIIYCCYCIIIGQKGKFQHLYFSGIGFIILRFLTNMY